MKAINRDHFQLINEVRNGNQQSLDLPADVSPTGNNSGNNLALRLQEMAEINYQLENLVLKGTKELNEVTETHNKFISILAHDLRSPFNTILGSLELLKTILASDITDDIKTCVNIAYNSAKRTLTLLDNLLAWSILQNKENCLNIVRIDLYKLFLEEIECIGPSAGQKKIKVYHSITPGLSVCADLERIKIIIRNLLSNAVKFTGTEGRIMISAFENKQFVEISIEDNGTGISPDIMKSLFTSSHKLRSTRGTQNETGTGLGLLLCKEVVEKQGGKIRAESEGKGSKFTFTLPHYI